ncbi:IPT/TIG domain-containing protein [Flagellimonas algicola]|uniref:Galactose oxidase n=1 Tax=Flagellimonas algicola TaxID=2583815 RepID=A0ABY2WJ78_9FLAO|nr:IPT/TIG domain-containing protein [Allomuricauda algicola]TMU54895.1 galactose oxidase [Allomuricauda algicola]
MEVLTKKINFSILCCLSLLLILISCGSDSDNPGVDDGPGLIPEPPPKITSIEPTSAARGEQVTITGTDFSNVASENLVEFNGVAATVGSATAIQIVTTVPEEATTGPLTITYNDQTGTSANDFEVLADAWRKKADFEGGSRFRAIAFAIDNMGYVGTGEDSEDNRLKDFWEFDPILNAWNKKQDFEGSARKAALGFAVGEKGFLGTGSDSEGNVKDFWEFDLGDNSWVQKADAFKIAGAQGFVIGNSIYLLSTGSKAFFEYDVSSDNWIERANFAGDSRSSAIGFSIDGRGYIGTGSGNGIKQDFWEYDPTSDEWIQKADFGGDARRGAISFVLSGKGYVGLGDNNAKVLRDLWEYDSELDSWTKKADFGGVAREYAVVFAIDNRAYVGTGRDNEGNHLSDFWEYIPD